MTLGEKIKAARKAKGWYQHDLAVAVGVEPPTVSRWESDLVEPDSQNLLAIAKATGKLIEWFLDQPIPGRIIEERLKFLEEHMMATGTAKLLGDGNLVLKKLWFTLQAADPAIQRACLYLCTGLEEDALEMEKTVRDETRLLRAHLKVGRE